MEVDIHDGYLSPTNMGLDGGWLGIYGEINKKFKK